MDDNKLIVAAAGSGKTTYIIEKALRIKDSNVLITTYTEANELEIKRKILAKRKYILSNITVQTWFSFLLQHGARPFQGSLYKKNIKGLAPLDVRSPLYTKEDCIQAHYFTNSQKIYHDKLSKFVIRCNEQKGFVIDRLSRIYSYIFIDEVQDLAGYDLDFLRLLFESNIVITLVGDPRQVVYLTHQPRRNSQFKNGKIKDFIIKNCDKYFNQSNIDETTLQVSHRNCQAICDFASKLYPEMLATRPCNCDSCCKEKLQHQGIFLVRRNDVRKYLQLHEPVELRIRSNIKVIGPDYSTMTFGQSKGLTFDHILIYPTVDFNKWLKDNSQSLAFTTRSKFYVAITRARYSVGIVYDFDEGEEIDEVQKYNLTNK